MQVNFNNHPLSRDSSLSSLDCREDHDKNHIQRLVFIEFVPKVLKDLKQNEQEPWALLFIVNCPAHPDEPDLRTIYGIKPAIFFPTNVTSVLQTLDQCVIAISHEADDTFCRLSEKIEKKNG